MAYIKKNSPVHHDLLEWLENVAQIHTENDYLLKSIDYLKHVVIIEYRMKGAYRLALVKNLIINTTVYFDETLKSTTSIKYLTTIFEDIELTKKLYDNYDRIVDLIFNDDWYLMFNKLASKKAANFNILDTVHNEIVGDEDVVAKLERIHFFVDELINFVKTII